MRPTTVAALLLVALTAVLYLPSLGHDFVILDDPLMVTDNEWVQAGWTLRGLKAAFSIDRVNFWVPLTWLSLMTDAALFGPGARGFHLTNLLLHAGNAALLFVALRRLTGAAGRSFAVAALFAVHPVHVESVAWITERKDVLCVFMLLLALLAWERWLRRRRPGAYAAACALFALALMAKPVAVVFPVLLLCLDGWPLRRLAPGALRGPLLEKVPLAVLGAAAAAATLVISWRLEAFVELDRFSPAMRAANLAIAYVRYLGLLAWPSGLAILYPLEEGGVSPAVAATALAALAVASALLWRARRRLPWALMGWVWFLAALLPVSGIFQVGLQALADRFLYLPALGIYVAVVWSAAALAARAAVPRWAAPALAGCVVLPLALAARHQLGFWRDGVTILQRTVAVTGSNPMARELLAYNLAGQDRLEEALEQYRVLQELRPGEPGPRFDAGNTLARLGRSEEAADAYRAALAREPRHAKARLSLALVLSRLGRTVEAVAEYRELLRRAPDFDVARYQFGVTLAAAGRFEEAAGELREFLRRAPGSAEGHYNLGVVLLELGAEAEGRRELARAVALDPRLAARLE